MASECCEVGLDLPEAGFVVADKIHLVDGKNDLAHAHEIENGCMPARLRFYPMAGIDEQNGEIGMARAGGHVAGVLLVAGTVDDDDPAGSGIEIAPGNIDGDALFAFGG